MTFGVLSVLVNFYPITQRPFSPLVQLTGCILHAAWLRNWNAADALLSKVLRRCFLCLKINCDSDWNNFFVVPGTTTVSLQERDRLTSSNFPCTFCST